MNVEEMFGELIAVMRKISDPQNDEILYHYTDMNGILGIFDNYICEMNAIKKEIESHLDEGGTRNKIIFNMLATDIRYLNDSREYKEGEEFLISKSYKPKVDESNNEKINYYNLSFCGEDDLLSQWGMYGKESGVAIGFNLGESEMSYFKRRKREDLEARKYKLYPIEVGYDESTQEKFYTKVQKELSDKYKIEDGNDLLAKIFIPYCKNIAFHAENEHRYIFPVSFSIDDYKYEIKYRYNKGVIKPTLTVNFYSEKLENCIKYLIVGPGYNQNQIFNALIHIFDRKKYFYHEEDEANKIIIEQDEFDKKECDQKVHNVKFEKVRFNKDNNKEEKYTVVRQSYKCENGIVIMKSFIPYRE